MTLYNAQLQTELAILSANLLLGSRSGDAQNLEWIVHGLRGLRSGCDQAHQVGNQRPAARQEQDARSPMPRWFAQQLLHRGRLVPALVKPALPGLCIVSLHHPMDHVRSRCGKSARYVYGTSKASTAVSANVKNCPPSSSYL